jgi:kinesin family protein 18/19
MNVPEEAFRQHRSREKHYAFDYAFGENSTQVEVFDKTTRFLIDGVLQGFNATVFAYGATGAGKTYTMLGELNSPGLMLMTFIELFEKIEKLSFDRAYKAKLSYLEIYNEMIRDLLNPSDANIEIREDPTKGVQVANLSEIMAMSPEEVISSIRLGNKRRTQEPTMANETSSRSHAVLQITVEHKDKASGVSSDIMVGKLSLIDLAGSERASNTMNRGLRLIEGANINRSLLALGNCINALCESVEKGAKVYIPYRDSKLTRLLKDSLGGNCRTVMVACISPFVNTYEDTHNTLKYANRAKNIKTNAKRNVFNVNSHISKYTQIISSLKLEILELRTQLQAKQSTGLINAPVLELHSIEINNHFKHEADLRKKLFEIDQSIEEMGFELFNVSTELNGAVKKQGTDSHRYKALKNEQMNIQERIRNRKTELENQRERLTDLIKKRMRSRRA